MRQGIDHLRTNRLLALDYVLGLRGFGLVIYGALPASLGALGAFKVPDQGILDSKIGLAALPYICCVALIPVVLTFVLVRQRLGNWYLLSSCLSLRAAVITLAIILVSSLVCGANGLLVGTYHLVVSKAAWNGLSFGAKAKPIGECLLLSFAYLVGSSTLFLAVVKEDGNLPLLPSKQEVDNLNLLRGYLKDVANGALQSERPTTNDQALADRVTVMTEMISEATKVLNTLQDGSTGLGRKRLYSELCSELSALSAAAQDVGQTFLTWPYYWGSGIDLAMLNEEQKKRRTKIERLRRLYFDA
jgi:hypothetical protein